MNENIDKNFSSVAQADVQAVLKPMPRREQTDITYSEDEYMLRVRRVYKPNINIIYAMRRTAVWFIATSQLLIKITRDRLLRKNNPASQGRYLREYFEQVGGTGIKIGQQLASRVDMFDFAICSELSKLIDDVTPLPFDKAKEIIECSLGKHFPEVFESIDPDPIGSASIACVYKGVLLNGDKVAIKVQRPGIDQQFCADVVIAEVLTRIMEFLTIAKTGTFKYLRFELEHLFYQELDFIQEARYQSLYRRDCKNEKIKWLYAPKVYHDLSSINVLITEYIEGFACSEIVRAVETNDTEMLATFYSLNINPKKVARRILYQSWWRRHEKPFFHADPHPANILVLPGNKIVMIDFGSCGTTAEKYRKGELAFARFTATDNITALVEICINNSTPLPPIDVEEFRSHLERNLWQNCLAQISKESEWWERTSAGVFIGLAKATKELNIPLVPNMLSIMRATLLYDTLALRLYPKFNLSKLFRRYIQYSNARRQKLYRKQSHRKYSRYLAARQVAEKARFRDTFEWGQFWLDAVTRNLPVGFQLLSKKSAYVFSVLLRLIMNIGILAGLTILGLWLFTFSGELTIIPDEMIKKIISNPVFLTLLALMCLQALRRISFRLSDPDPNK